MVFFHPWDACISETSGNMHYVNLDWYNDCLYVFLKKQLISFILKNKL